MIPVRRVWIVFACLICAITVPPVAAQPAPRAVQVIPNAANNNKSSAYQFGPDAEMIVTGVENATIEGSESQHSCLSSPSAGSKSVWFEVFLVEGQVSINTAGTSYGTGSGNSPDSVMSLYFGNRFTPFSQLIPIACNDNGTNAAAFANLPISVSGTYLIQVSASTAITVTTTSQVNVLVTHSPDAPASNDQPSGAKSLKFPVLGALVDTYYATADLNEPSDPALAGPIYYTVWYKFDLADASPIVIQQLNLNSFVDLWFTFYEDNGGTLVIPTGRISSSIGFTSALLNPGSYYIRVGSMTPSPALTEQFVATGYLVPNNIDFSVDGYEDTDTSGLPVADLSGWTVKNGDPGETAICDTIAPFNCYFLFDSSGAGEATKLKAKVNLADYKIKTGDVFTFNMSTTLVGDPNLAISVKLVDAADASLKFSKKYDIGIPNPFQFISLAPTPIKPVKAIVKLKNKDTDFGDTVKLDNFVAGVLRLGKYHSRFTPVLNGLKLELTEAWLNSGGDDLLPVPAAPKPSAGWR